MNESPKVLVMTVGLPRSGKSTWARTTGLPIVNPDSIRLAIHGKPFIGLAEPFVWATAKAMVRALFLAGHDRVVLDATNTTEKRRAEWASPAWSREFVVFDTDPETCRQRALVTCGDDEEWDGLLKAIERMHNNWEPPSGSEWTIYTPEGYDHLHRS